MLTPRDWAAGPPAPLAEPVATHAA
jgi:hypothetical protein